MLKNGKIYNESYPVNQDSSNSKGNAFGMNAIGVINTPIVCCPVRLQRFIPFY